MTTTTGNAAAVLDWLEEWLQTEWPELRRALHLGDRAVGDGRGRRAAVARRCSPRSRPTWTCRREAFPFMTFRETARRPGMPGRIFRICFSGELATRSTSALVRAARCGSAVCAAGATVGITPYGTETMHVLRAEKGYPIVGQDTDGTVTPQDLGMDWIVSKPEGLHRQALVRRADTAAARPQASGRPAAGRPHALLPEGAQLVAPDVRSLPTGAGADARARHLAAIAARLWAGRSRSRWSPAAGTGSASAVAPVDDRLIAVEVAAPVLYDPEGTKRDG